MKIEKLKRLNVWKWIGLTLIFCVIVFIITYNTTKAKYRFTASYQAAYGTINWKVGDISILAVNIEQDDGSYLESEDFPTDGYILNTDESYCIVSVNGEQVKQDVTLSYENNSLTINNITKKGTKCFLYFDKDPCNGSAACELILANNTIDTSRKSGEFTSIFEEDTAGRIFEGPADDYGDTTYFFAGANPNNWVKFAGFYWRIIRVNGNGSLRLIYNGTTTDQTGEGTQIVKSAFNSTRTDNAYVGYMYGTTGSSTYAATHANTNSSTIKGVLDTWYQSNIASYSDKIDTEVGFCGDRQPSTSSSSLNGSGGTATKTTYYAPYIRAASTHQFVYTCAVSSDLYTVSSSSYGNKVLTYPIGLITADEVQFAGGFGGTANSSYWLYTKSRYWTMSPSFFNGHSAFAFFVTSTGELYKDNAYGVDDSMGVRPVLTVASDGLTSGTGTATDPYIVS